MLLLVVAEAVAVLTTATASFLSDPCDGQRPRLAVCLAPVVAIMAQAVLTGVARDALDVGRLWGG